MKSTTPQQVQPKGGWRHDSAYGYKNNHNNHNHNLFLRSVLVVIISLLLSLSGCADAAPTSAIIEQDADLSSFQTALNATTADAAAPTNLASQLDALSPVTVFCPTNAAFAAAPSSVSTLLLSSGQPASGGGSWIGHVTALIQYHVVHVETASQPLTAATLTNALNIGSKQLWYKDSGKLTVSKNGAAGTISISGKAFSNSQIVTPDIAADNGVLHKVNQVFVPTFLTKNLFEASQEIKGFSLALPFIVKAGLEETLRSGTITLFGPTTKAMAQLPTAFINQVAKDRATVRLLFHNHMARGVWPAELLTHGRTITMLSGKTYTVTVAAADNVIKIGDAVIEEFNELASNGVVHSLANVLLPPGAMEGPSGPAPAPAPLAPEPPATGVALTISNQDDLSALEIAMRNARLVRLLSGRGPYTVFAPTDAAFAAAANANPIVAKFFDAPDEWKAHLVALVRFHVHRGYAALTAADMINGMSINNFLRVQPAESFTVTVNGGGGAFTLTSSSNAATTSTVVTPDLTADNGVVHKMDRVLIPAALTRSVWDGLTAAATFYAGFGQVVALITQAGLEETVRTQDGITFFAPADQAFQILSDQVQIELYSNPNRLQQVLKNHMVQGLYYKDRLTDGAQLETLAGQTLRLSVRGNRFFKEHYIDTAYMEVMDIVGSNGLAHVIDTVLIPPVPGSGFVCTVCPPGFDLTKPETEVSIPLGVVDGIEEASCALIDVVVNNSPGQFDAGVCSFLRDFYTTPCGCQASPKTTTSSANGDDNNNRYLRSSLLSL